MSHTTAQEEDTEEEHSSVLDTFGDWFHVLVLTAIVVFMAAVRLQSYENFVRNNEVLFAGNDAWYHLREVRYTVRHWPRTMPFDPWTNFPFGTSVGQFGTLYDQLIATAALIVGLGSPGRELVAKTLLVAPAIAGALTAIPAYYVGKRLGGTIGGLFSALLLALLPGMFLQRTLVGVSDHNAAEPLFQTFAVLALMIAFAVAEREKPVWELFRARDVAGLRNSVLWAALAGVVTALYMWMWPPGVLLVGIVGVFLVLKLTSDVVAGDSPEPIAIAGAVSMSVTGLLMLVPLQSLSFQPTEFSLVQPVVALGVAAGSAFMAWLAREWEARDVDASFYPVAVFGLILLAFGAMALFLDGLFATIQTNFLRILGFSAGAATRTIGEAQPYLAPDILQSRGYTPVSRIVSDYGVTLFTALAATIWMLAKPLVEDGDAREYGYVVGSLIVVGLLYLVPAVPAAIGGWVGIEPQLIGLALVTGIVVGATLLTQYEAEHLLVVVWAAFITSAAFTQVRFNYYLAVVVVVMNGYLLGEVLGYLDLRGAGVGDRVSDVETYQVITLLMVFLLITAPALVVPLSVRNTGTAAYDQSNTAIEAAGSAGPGSVTHWKGSLEWMQHNTPREGNLYGANNTEEMDYYGTYRSTDDFAYPDGSYGVQSWWDYGHWITVLGHRIPNANPFQQGATSAANYLLAPSPAQAREVLNNRSIDSAGNETTKYVMVDWQMVEPTSKFGAPVVFYDSSNVSQSDFYKRVYAVQNGSVAGSFMLKHQRYYESMMVRLYEYHGSAMPPQPVVVDWERRQFQTRGGGTVTVPTVPTGTNATAVRRFRSMSQARAYVRNDSTAQIGGLGPYPSERVSALKHYRLVKVSNASATRARAYTNSLVSTARLLGFRPSQLIKTQPSWVKTFERVPGAEVQGTGAPPNSTVTARVQMRALTTNSTFYYTQRAQVNADGEFNMTLPYSTTRYERYTPEEGYTDVNVEAVNGYTFTTQPRLSSSGGNTSVVRYQAQNVSVPEGLVNGARNGTVTVSLKRTEQSLGSGNASNGNATAGNVTSGNATVGNTTSGNATVGNATAASALRGADAETESFADPTDAVAGPELAAEPRRSGA